MNILAIETSSTVCTVSLRCGTSTVTREQDAPRQHAQCMLPFIKALLDEQACSLNALDFIVYGRGPGSFTGLRIATSVVQALALAHDVPVIAVSSLHAIAQTAYQSHGVKKALVAIDARMQNVYWGAYEYDISEQRMMPCSEELAMHPKELPSITTKQWVGVGNGWHDPALQTHHAENVSHFLLEITAGSRALIELGIPMYLSGQHLKPHEVQSFYLKQPVYRQSEVHYETTY